MTATPDVIIPKKAVGICACGCNIAQQPTIDIMKRQVVDLPLKLVEWTEYQIEVKQCSCGKKHYGDMAHLMPVQYGQRIKALAVYLNHQQFVPYDRMQEIFSDLFGVSIGDKVLFDANETCYKNLEETERLIIEALKASPVMHNDETGLRCESKLKWVHVSSTHRLTNYTIHEKRGKEAIDFIGILTEYHGNSVHDRYSSYDKYKCNHSLCNAHLLRELIFLVEEHGKEWATRMIRLLLTGKKLKETDKLRKSNREKIFKIYDKLVNKYIPLEEKLQEKNLPTKRGRKPKTKALRLLEAFRDRKEQILKFLTQPEVPFDNNQAERDLRMIKLKQKISGTMRTHHGAEIFCRIRGYISTARKQGNPILDAITGAMSGNPVVFS